MINEYRLIYKKKSIGYKTRHALRDWVFDSPKTTSKKERKGNENG